MRIALIPGSFDPVHNGHLEVIERAARLFDEVVVATLRNPQKSEALFELDERQEMLEESLAHLVNVRIVSVSTLVVNVAHDVGASAIVKGLRAVSDFENELQMAQMNKQLSGVETLFIPTSSAHSFIASRLLREVARFGGDVTSFVPKVVAHRLRRSSPMSDLFEDLDQQRAAGEEHDAEALIRSALDLVQTAKAMPLSASVLVSRDELAELLQAALDRMPDELRQARGCSRSARSSWPRRAARPTPSWRRCGSRPSGWSSAPRSSARPTTWPSASSTTPTRRPGACVTRPRTMPTRSWPASRSCSTAR